MTDFDDNNVVIQQVSAEVARLSAVNANFRAFLESVGNDMFDSNADSDEIGSRLITAFYERETIARLAEEEAEREAQEEAEYEAFSAEWDARIVPITPDKLVQAEPKKPSCSIDPLDDCLPVARSIRRPRLVKNKPVPFHTRVMNQVEQDQADARAYRDLMKAIKSGNMMLVNSATIASIMSAVVPKVEAPKVEVEAPKVEEEMVLVPTKLDFDSIEVVPERRTWGVLPKANVATIGTDFKCMATVEAKVEVVEIVRTPIPCLDALVEACTNPNCSMTHYTRATWASAPQCRHKYCRSTCFSNAVCLPNGKIEACLGTTKNGRPCAFVHKNEKPYQYWARVNNMGVCQKSKCNCAREHFVPNPCPTVDCPAVFMLPSKGKECMYINAPGCEVCPFTHRNESHASLVARTAK